MKENNNKNSVELCVLCGEPEAVILANGDYPTHPIPLQILANAPYIVCCDGGADAYINRGNVPDVIIGDGDSLSEENRRKYSHILHCVSDQETNDQTKAVNFLLSQGKKNIAIVGATGKREDHTCSFPSQPGQQISIINFGAHNLRGKGLVYPLSDFTNWWQGTLNESTETEFTIHAEGEYLVVINY